MVLDAGKTSEVAKWRVRFPYFKTLVMTVCTYLVVHQPCSAHCNCPYRTLFGMPEPDIHCQFHLDGQRLSP